MIHTLPSEIVQVITDKLSFYDKLNMCTTCHRLYDKISRTNLYQTLTVYKKTEDIIRMFHDKTLDGSQVQTLEIMLDDLCDELYSNLADIFPNLTQVKAPRPNKNQYFRLEHKERAELIYRPLLKWRNTLKKYNTRFDWKYFLNDLFSSIFPRLEELEIYSSFLFPNRKEGFDPLFLSKGITNAPMLTRLYLDYCDVSIDSLEVIHHGCPQIHYLKFVETILVVDSDILPLSIAPANSVLYLNVHAACFDKSGLFLDYIIYKYPNLQVLYIYISNYDGRYGIPSLFTDFFPKYNHGYGVNVNENSEEYDLIYGNLLDELEPTIDNYKHNGSSFLSRLPKSIKKLGLSLDLFDTAIETISKVNLELSVLELHKLENPDSLTKSGQLGYIKNINSLRSLSIYLKSSVQSSELDLISLTVTTLDIKLLGKGFCISWIFAMFPSLESLRVKSKEYLLVENEATKFARVGKIYPKLRKLDFGFCNVHPESLNYIKTVFPNVKEVIWNAYIEFDDSYRKSYTADFTGWSLNKLDFIMVSTQYKLKYYYTVVSTPKETKRSLLKIYTGEILPVEGNPDSMEGASKVIIVRDHVKHFYVKCERVRY